MPKRPLKRPATSGTRKGNGVGKGVGWGGPANGAGSAKGLAEAFEPGNAEADGQHDMWRTKSAQDFKDHLAKLAFTAEREETQLSASVAWLNREEGTPIARNVNLDAADIRELTDAELVTQFEAASRAFAAASGGDDAEGSGKPH